MDEVKLKEIVDKYKKETKHKKARKYEVLIDFTDIAILVKNSLN